MRRVAEGLTYQDLGDQGITEDLGAQWVTKDLSVPAGGKCDSPSLGQGLTEAWKHPNLILIVPGDTDYVGQAHEEGLTAQGYRGLGGQGHRGLGGAPAAEVEGGAGPRRLSDREDDEGSPRHRDPRYNSPHDALENDNTVYGDDGVNHVSWLCI